MGEGEVADGKVLVCMVQGVTLEDWNDEESEESGFQLLESVCVRDGADRYEINNEKEMGQGVGKRERQKSLGNRVQETL